MTKASYIEQFGPISNRELKIAHEIRRDHGIDIQDWKLPNYKVLSQRYINLMIAFRLHLKHNCRKNFKESFYRMAPIKNNKGVEAVNYTGHTMAYDGFRFFGDYTFSILDKSKKMDIIGEKLYLIEGSYPIYSVTSCLEEDIARVKRTNPSYLTEEPIVTEIIAYKSSNQLPT